MVDSNNVLILPEPFASNLARLNMQIKRRKGRFSVNGSQMFGHPQNLKEAFYIGWQDQVDIYDASKGYAHVDREHVGTINVPALGGSGQGYLFMLKDLETNDWVPVALWNAENDKLSWRQDRQASEIIAAHFNGIARYEGSKLLSTLVIVFMIIGVVTLYFCVGVLFFIAAGVCASANAKKQKRKTKRILTSSQIGGIIDELGNHLRFHGSLMGDWMLEANGVSRSPRV